MTAIEKLRKLADWFNLYQEGKSMSVTDTEKLVK